MKIIVEGEIPKKTKRFKCDYCGCEFEADKDEYKSVNYVYVREYQCGCPCCQETVSVDN